MRVGGGARRPRPLRRPGEDSGEAVHRRVQGFLLSDDGGEGERREGEFLIKYPGSQATAGGEEEGGGQGVPGEILSRARRGDLQAVVAWAEHGLACGGEGDPFLTRVRELAVGFEKNKLLKLLERGPRAAGP